MPGEAAAAGGPCRSCGHDWPVPWFWLVWPWGARWIVCGPLCALECLEQGRL